MSIFDYAIGLMISRKTFFTMKASHFFLFFLIVSLFAACNVPEDRFYIKGEIEGIRQAEFYIYNEEGIKENVDTIHIQDGRFSYECKLDSPVIMTLLYPNFSRTYLVAEPGTELKMKGQASKLSAVDISGTKENELLTKFRLRNAAKPEKEVQMAAMQFVHDHPASLAALAVFKRYCGQREKHDSEIVLPLLDDLKKAQPQNKVVQMAEEQFRSQLLTGIGCKLPDFSAVTLAGDTITNKDFEGKKLLIVFWAPWCADSYGLMEAVARIENKNPDKLKVLLVSVDYNENPTKVRMRQSNVNSPGVCEKRAFSSPLVKTLGVRYVPGNLFVNEEGIIEKRDISSVSELQKKAIDWVKK